MPRVLLVLAAAVLVSACQKKDSASGEAGKPFEVSTSVEGQLTPGGKGELVAHIRAGKGLHVNAEYPHNFRPDVADGGVVQFEQDRFPLADSAEKVPCNDGTKDACALRARIPFGVAKPGEEKVAGTLSFSVCSEERCLIEKVKVEVPVQAR